MWPTPMISSVFPPMWLLKHCRHRRLRWLATISGTRLLSMRTAIAAYSVARRPWTPRLLVSTAPGGSQSSGSRWFTPAACACIHFNRGARRARSWRGMSHANTTSAVFSRFSSTSPSYPMEVRTRPRSAGRRASASRTRTRSASNTGPSALTFSTCRWIFDRATVPLLLRRNPTRPSRNLDSADRCPVRAGYDVISRDSGNDAIDGALVAATTVIPAKTGMMPSTAAFNAANAGRLAKQAADLVRSACAAVNRWETAAGRGLGRCRSDTPPSDRVTSPPASAPRRGTVPARARNGCGTGTPTER